MSTITDPKIHELRISLSPTDKAAIKETARSQRTASLAFYKAIYPHAVIADTCWKEIMVIGAINECPRGSIRRACSNLKVEGFLEILSHNRRKGDYGVDNCKYKYRPQKGVQLEIY